MGKFDKFKDAKRIITEAGNISKCPCCNYHKQAIIQCAIHGHQPPEAYQEGLKYKEEPKNENTN